MIADQPLDATGWATYGKIHNLAGETTHLANCVELRQPLFSVAQSGTIEDWLQPWGPLVAEVARWYAIAGWTDSQHEIESVLQHLHDLMAAGDYPRSTFRRPVVQHSATDKTALRLNGAWLTCGKPFLCEAIHNAQSGLRAEAKAAAWRLVHGSMEAQFLAELQALQPPSIYN